MRINEISASKFSKPLGSGIKATHHQTYQEYGYTVSKLREFLKSRGWEFVDEGVYSEVYYNPKKNLILKVNKKEDPAYDYFVGLTKTYESKHFPRISDKLDIKNGYSAYLMEKLNDLMDLGLKNEISDFVAILQHPNIKWDQNVIDRANKLKNTYPKLAEAITFLVENRKSYNLDIMGANIMRRGRTLVIVDPYFASGI